MKRTKRASAKSLARQDEEVAAVRRMDKLDCIINTNQLRDKDHQALARMKELERSYAGRLRTTRVDSKTVVTTLIK